jgi:hypothetical protein
VRRGGRLRVELVPERFSTGRWERVGSWAAGALPHAYGADDGWFEWRFNVRASARSAKLVARLSSEFPGAHAPPDGSSRAIVRLDGRKRAELEVVPDDGLGTVHRVALGPLKPGPHTLQLAVEPGAKANGLCVYGGKPGAFRIELEP